MFRNTKRPSRIGASVTPIAFLPGRGKRPKWGQRIFRFYLFLLKATPAHRQLDLWVLSEEWLLSVEVSDCLEADNEATLYSCVQSLSPFLSPGMREGDRRGCHSKLRRSKPEQGKARQGLVWVWVFVMLSGASETRKQSQLYQWCLQNTF